MKRRKRNNRIGFYVAGAMVALALVVLAGWGIWELVSLVPPDWARVWAIAATLFLPIVGWGCWELGQTESKGKLHGIDAGIERVTRAASTAIDLRATSVRKMRQAQTDSPVVLPPLPETIIVEQSQLQSGEVVDL